MASEGALLSGLPGRYARALYAHADEIGALDAVVAGMRALGELIDASPQFRALLDNPTLDAARARDAALAVLGRQGAPEAVRAFVGVVALHRRLSSLRRIVTGFMRLEAARRGIQGVEVASARPLSQVQRNQLRARLLEMGHAEVELHETVDPALLGGLRVRIGARLYDTSLQSQLQRMQHAMKGAA